VSYTFKGENDMPVLNSFHSRCHLALIVGLALASPFASAASQCKGIAENACMVESECLWVQGYTRKDGRTVASHCKSKGGKKDDQAADAGSLKFSTAN
jgi:hypothetical protein